MAAAELFESRPQTRVGPSPHMVIALVGLAFEARIAATPHVFVLCGKDGRERFATVDAPMEESCRALVSFGVAGGVAPYLKPGDLVIASSVLDSTTTHQTDLSWSERLRSAMPDAHYVPIMGVDDPIVDPCTKRELNQRTGAAAVDMESHLVARLAAARDLAFVSIRVIVDPANRAVPPAAIAGMLPDGTTSVGAVLASLVSKPSQAFAMARIAFDLYAARNALLRVRERLGHGFGLLDTQ
jgi:hopanoid-associated phosphorylase